MQEPTPPGLSPVRRPGVAAPVEKEALRAFSSVIGAVVRTREPLEQHTSLRVGGPAAVFLDVFSHRAVETAHQLCRALGMPFLPLAGGTNVFFGQAGWPGCVARIRFDAVRRGAGGTVVAEAGATVAQLTHFCIEAGLSGFEFASGIPGSIGGAVYGNAGAYGHSIGEILRSARILTPEGTVEAVPGDFFRFAYRRSLLCEYPAVVLEVELALVPGDRGAIQRACEQILEIRGWKLPPPETPTAGSWFKNVETDEGRRIPAAIYLDAVGSKETRVGDAAVHPKHANIFYNAGRARADDFLALEEILRGRVLERFGIRLEREVRYFGS